MVKPEVVTEAVQSDQKQDERHKGNSAAKYRDQALEGLRGAREHRGSAFMSGYRLLMNVKPPGRSRSPDERPTFGERKITVNASRRASGASEYSDETDRAVAFGRAVFPDDRSFSQLIVTTTQGANHAELNSRESSSRDGRLEVGHFEHGFAVSIWRERSSHRHALGHLHDTLEIPTACASETRR